MKLLQKRKRIICLKIIWQQQQGHGERKFSKSGPRRGVKHLGLEQLSEPESGTSRHDSGKVKKCQKVGLRQNQSELA